MGEFPILSYTHVLTEACSIMRNICVESVLLEICRFSVEFSGVSRNRALAYLP